jgi:predicted 3-demethylubiquinone-9 3-methyltransferase (glyoxalase superfamily)
MKVTPFLWFDDAAEQAVEHYRAVFGDGVQVLETKRAGGKVMSVTFRVAGQELMAFNGGPHFKFSEAISLFVSCDTQDEIDRLWEQLSEGGRKDRCGWLKDKYGLSWQIVPKVLGELMGDPDPAKAGRVVKAMLGMTKLEIAGLRKAHDGA